MEALSSPPLWSSIATGTVRRGSLVEVAPAVVTGRSRSVRGSVAEVIEVSEDGMFVDLQLLRKRDLEPFKRPAEGIKRGVLRDAIVSVLQPVGQMAAAATAHPRLRSALSSRGPAQSRSPLAAGSADKWCRLTVPPSGALFIFWDLETNEGCRLCNAITQIAAVARLFRGGEFAGIGAPDYERYVTTGAPMNTVASKMTGITKTLLSRQGVSLREALLAFEQWVQSVHQHILPLPAPSSHLPIGDDGDDELHDAMSEPEDDGVDGEGDGVMPVVMVSHRGFICDLPLLFQSVDKTLNVKGPDFLQRAGVFHVADSYYVALDMRQKGKAFTGRESLGLSELHTRLVGRPHGNAHNALGDSRALAAVCGREPLLGAWRSEKVAMRVSDYVREKQQRS
ncbi:unnamed protein product [Vitrella brassicaformis CCMP3155]|uniref:Exonuclease domain-containing protein n=2 Tax=Vitrella brassicaformis TaxID=1169539 RepID=A0A0G4E9D3_VITBC|nr:unnamed protein product [Vitrella brassicaformis CCMP3155]|eukprot:CEL92201.1 unnamed protein product [Vitrella brassicaformis CCMP3155]